MVRPSIGISSDYNYILRMNLKSGCADYNFDDPFKTSTENNCRFRMETVHTVEGEPFDVVLLILKEKGAHGSFYRTMLSKGLKTFDDEELRIAYVGMTRPRKLLVLAVPSEQSRIIWEQKLVY